MIIDKIPFEMRMLFEGLAQNVYLLMMAHLTEAKP
jgi:hypothetical protein